MKKLGRDEEIIHYFLSLRGITRYRLIDYHPHGRTLPGGINHFELESHSGWVVTPEEVYFVWLVWVGGEHGHYALIDKPGDWVPVSLQEEDGDRQQKIFKIQQDMKEDAQVGVHEWHRSLREPGKATEREEVIIGSRLRGSRLRWQDYGFENYVLVNVQSGGHDLVGSLYPGEVQDITAILVLPYEVCRLTLGWSWEQGYYTFGEETGPSGWYNGRSVRSWYGNRLRRCSMLCARRLNGKCKSNGRPTRKSTGKSRKKLLTKRRTIVLGEHWWLAHR